MSINSRMKTWSRKINDKEIPTWQITGLQAIAIGLAVTWVAVLVPLNPLPGQTTVTQLVADSGSLNSKAVTKQKERCHETPQFCG